MTNSICLPTNILLALALWLVGPLKQSIALQPTALRIPTDSFLVFSVKADNLIDKSSIRSSETWSPLLADWASRYPEIYEAFLDENTSGLNFKLPIQFFARMEKVDSPVPVFGLISQVSNPKRIDQTLRTLAELFDLKKRGSTPLIYGHSNFPFEIGRKGKIFILVGTPSPKSPLTDQILSMTIEKVFRDLPEKPLLGIPDSLQKHFQKPADASLYLDGTGLARAFEEFLPKIPSFWIQTSLPVIEKMAYRPFGIYLRSNPGSLHLSIVDHSPMGFDLNSSSSPNSMLTSIPGDAPIIGKISLSENTFKETVFNVINSVLSKISSGKLNATSTLPGIDSSVRDILSVPSGEFVFGIGPPRTSIRNDANSPTKKTKTLEPPFYMGIGIEDILQARQLIASLNSANSLNAILEHKNLKLGFLESELWLATAEYSREIFLAKPLRKIGQKRMEFLAKHPISIDLKVQSLTQPLRQDERLSYEDLKNLYFLDHFSNFSTWTEQNSIKFLIRTRNKEVQGLQTLAEHLGQELVDSKNALLYSAIANNDFNLLAQEVEKGALINANDRFGHTPMHYAAYKGNAEFFQFLLSKGGDPNARGRQNSTPLHSATWGRNKAVSKLLLEQGAEVDAKSNEGETPSMTAALRGEKELLEIFFALSADPHAKDIHGTNLLDLAAAGGHEAVFELLMDIGVKNQHPLHTAVGLGKINEVKKLLKQGRKVDELDSFGATPLLFAFVSGNEDMVEFLLRRKANPTIEAKEGYSIMHAAAFSGKKTLVNKALSLGLDLNVRFGEDGTTPTDVAEDDSEGYRFLRAMGAKTSWELGPHFK
ncbi:MAG: ankyrin repeat domain-containing protein [Verrucomicrobiota bacterium]|nr:ankyrin repeat domain-containing protein [Verrucomicrobiota bacterium]